MCDRIDWLMDGHFNESLCDYRNCDVTVMGLGQFGGGAGVVRFLLDRGARVTVTDLASESDLATSLQKIDTHELHALHLGGHVEADFRETDLVVVNPAVPRENRYLEIARSVGVPLTSEMNLFWQYQCGRIIGVTGSNGKSTTAAMIHAMLQAGKVTSRLGGNIGVSLLSEVDKIQPNDWTVLELSSFQLDDLDRLPSSPDIAVVTNFSPNHLDRHGSLDEYRHAKQTIVRWQTPEGIAVLNADDADVSDWPVHGRRYYFGSSRTKETGVFHDEKGTLIQQSGESREVDLSDCLHLPGSHNRANAAAAMCAAMSVGVSIESMKEGLNNFQGLPHRLQFVAEVSGRRFYNDSLATTPESVRAAVSAFSQPVVILAGGHDKQIPLTELAETIAKGTKAAALMGQTADVLQLLIESAETPILPTMQVSSTFEESFVWACQQSEPGDVVLLSPGCASYDWFHNFQERGETFIELVSRYGN
jgi:UDP-N-acetylmuramoylalanine--D-glutamate ligase